MSDPSSAPPPPPQDPSSGSSGAPYGGDPAAGGPGDAYGGASASAGVPPPYGAPPPPSTYGQAPPPAYGQWAPPSVPPYGTAGGPPPSVPGHQDWQGQQVWQAPQYAGQAPPWQSAYGQGSDPLAQARTASAGPRLGARVLDWLIVGIPFAVIGFGLGYFTGAAEYSASSPVLWDGATVALQLAEMVARIVYHAAFVAMKGATPGKMASGVRVVDERTGQRLSFGRAVGREIVLMLSALVCLLGYFSLFFDSFGLNRGWHDKAVHSRVIRS